MLLFSARRGRPRHERSQRLRKQVVRYGLFWMGADDCVSEKIQTRAGHIYRVTLILWLSWFARASCLARAYAMPVFSPASCRAVVQGGGGQGRSPGRAVGNSAQHSSGLQGPSRRWISILDIPDRGQRQQGLLHDLPGYGPAFFSLSVEASLLFMPFSRQEQIAKDGDPAAWTLCTNGEAHFTLVHTIVNARRLRIKQQARASTSSSTAWSRISLDSFDR